MININPSIFKSYDIRGTYPDQINENNIPSIVGSIYQFFQNKLQKKHLKVVVGRDMRLSGKALIKKLIEELVLSGGYVTDIGLVSTPSLYYESFTGDYDFGIQLTASHNPPAYNGLKIVQKSLNGLIKIGKSSGMEDIKNIALSYSPLHIAGGTLNHKNNVLKKEVEDMLTYMPLDKKVSFKVAADPANAMGGLYIKELFSYYSNINLIMINENLDGSFPSHQPDPLIKANLRQLQETVKQEQADIGLAPDGDGDRMFFIDEQGDIIPSSVVTSIIAKRLLKKSPRSKILFDIRYTITASENIENWGGTYDITKVGHAFITEKMAETGALFAGESSGHYYFARTGNAENQIPVITSILAEMFETGKKASQLTKMYQKSYESGEYNFKTENAKDILEQLKKQYSNGRMVLIDGVAIEYPTWRFGVRSSNTEPLMRLNIESKTKKEMEEKRDELIRFISANGQAELIKE